MSLRSSRCVVVLASATDQTARTQRSGPRGVVLVRDLAARPTGRTDPDTGAPLPDGWLHPGDASPPAVGLAWALADLVDRDVILRVYLAALVGDAAAWTAAVPTVAEAVTDAQDASVWTAPELVLVQRAAHAGLRTAIGRAWPSVPVQWLASLEDARASVGALRPRRSR